MCLVHPCILSRTLADSAGSLVLLPVLAGQHAGVDVVNRVVELIDGQSRYRVLVAVDGSDAAGKTTFADRLASAVEAPTVRVSVDSFLRPPDHGLRCGKAGRRAPYGQTVVVPARAVLVVDGVFLQREQLRELWTVAIYLKVSPAEFLERARRRDRAVLGSVAEVERRYRGRYLPGQVLYRDDATPETAADVLIDNEDPASPVLVRWPSSSPG